MFKPSRGPKHETRGDKRKWGDAPPSIATPTSAVLCMPLQPTPSILPPFTAAQSTPPLASGEDEFEVVSQSGMETHTPEGARSPELRGDENPPSNGWWELYERQRREDAIWEPPLVIGRSLGVNLSEWQVACRTVKQWEAILEHHIAQNVDRSALTAVLEELKLARTRLHELPINEKTVTPMYELEETSNQAIQDRLEILHRAHSSSRFPPEARNIAAAIRAYETGEIQYWDKYTVIWNGEIAGYFPTYRSFCENRASLVADFAERHSPGWLWYEEPLQPRSMPTTLEGTGPAAPATAMRATATVMEDRLGYGFGSWTITMGFRRLKPYVSKEATGEDAAEGQDCNEGRVPYKSRFAEGLALEPDETVPQIHFDVLLDSGATYPILYQSDLVHLGISPTSYAAQSVTRVATVNGNIDMALYEMLASVTDINCGSLVDENRAVWPSEPAMLGNVVPVGTMRASQGRRKSQQSMPVTLSASGERSAVRNRASGCGRLSGMLPFISCYLTAAPGTGVIWMGEDRSDVLGVDKFPGQLSYSSKTKPAAAERLRRLAEGGATIGVHFEQTVPEGGSITDQDTEFGSSTLTRYDANGEVMETVIVDPTDRSEAERGNI